MLAIEDLTKTYPARKGGQPVQALKGVSLQVREGDLFALLGPSGCGKTTMIQTIAGLEIPTSGKIRIAGNPVFDSSAGLVVPANRRKLGMVFQSYAIWPHMTVFENVAFPLRYGREKVAKGEIRALVMTALDRVKLADFADRLTPHLSGGQQQRVALARAIVHEPRLLLLDEPLSNLDARLRDTMREELRHLVKSLGITTVFVTHDQVEAMGMADRIAILRDGEIVQTGTPEDVYFTPNSAFSANFVGRSNMLKGRVAGIEVRDGLECRIFETAIGQLRSTAPSSLGIGQAGICVIRPQAFILNGGRHEELGLRNSIEGTLANRAFLGDVIEGQLIVGGEALRIVLNSYDQVQEGASLQFSIPADRCSLVPVEA
jgi:iron(III) transport system ATP-binding protein